MQENGDLMLYCFSANILATRQISIALDHTGVIALTTAGTQTVSQTDRWLNVLWAIKWGRLAHVAVNRPTVGRWPMIVMLLAVATKRFLRHHADIGVIDHVTIWQAMWWCDTVGRMGTRGRRTWRDKVLELSTKIACTWPLWCSYCYMQQKPDYFRVTKNVGGIPCETPTSSKKP